MDLPILFDSIALLLLVVASAFFSSAETALTMVNKIQLQLLAEEGNKRAAKALKVTEQHSKMLSAILIGNNVINLSASALATSMTIAVWGNKYVAIATGILTFVILMVGEIIPKSVATVYSKKLSLIYAPLIWLLMVVLTPLIFISEKLRQIILKPFGLDKAEADDAMTEDELKSLVDVGLEEGAIEDDEFEMISNVFSLDDSIARDIMVPKADMVFVPYDATREELIEIYKEHKFTRYPVYLDSTDTVIGTINIKDLIEFDETEEFAIKKIMRKPNFIFEHKEVGTLLMEMREETLSIVIVLDEYGTTSGLVTLEDILEEIVGEIRDEYDQDEKDSVTELKEDMEYLVEGSTNLNDVNEEVGLNLESKDYDTIGGFLIQHFDRLPKSGEVLELEDGTRIISEIVHNNRVEKVHIIKKRG